MKAAQVFFAVCAVGVVSAVPHNHGGGHHGGKKGGRMGGPMALRRMMMGKKFEMFVSTGIEDDCGTVPEDIIMGNPMKDGCSMSAAPGDQVCLCVKKPNEMIEMMREMGDDLATLNEDTGYMGVCGTCMDPCSLRWKKDDMGMDSMESMEMMGGDMGMMMPPPPMMMMMNGQSRRVPRVVQSLMQEAMQIMESHGGFSSEEDGMSDSMSSSAESESA